jgi:hypothetical protein
MGRKVEDQDHRFRFYGLHHHRTHPMDIDNAALTLDDDGQNFSIRLYNGSVFSPRL